MNREVKVITCVPILDEQVELQLLHLLKLQTGILSDWS